jgi:hypothetical protein
MVVANLVVVRAKTATVRTRFVNGLNAGVVIVRARTFMAGPGLSSLWPILSLLGLRQPQSGPGL